MNPLNLAKYFVAFNLTLALTSILLLLIAWLNGRSSHKIKYRHLLNITYSMLFVSLTAPLLAFFQSNSNIWGPKAQIWSALNAKSLVPYDLNEMTQPLSVISLGSTITSFQSNNLTKIFLTTLALGILFVTARLLKDMRILTKIIREGFEVKRIGRVSIILTDRLLVPFSVWRRFRAYVVLPSMIFENQPNLLLVLKHELQHHRQNDTKWVYIIQMVRALCFWNPFIILLQKQVTDIQEAACDETLIGHRGVSSKVYCDCLLWVAQKTLSSRAHLVGTAGFTRHSAANTLRRRIEEMLKKRTKQVSGKVATAIGIMAVGSLAMAVFASNASIQDRRITLQEAQRMAKTATSDDFPIVINKPVLDQLNRFLGTPDGREFMRRSLRQMSNFETKVNDYLDLYQLPHELLAIPLLESGYRNLKSYGNSQHGAGIWMFIAETARNFGLQVDATVDERMNVALETDAAMRLLGALHLQFKDWQLVLLGYNGGNELVSRGIRESGSRDVWELMRLGYENDPQYVASIMTAILIMRNPTSLD